MYDLANKRIWVAGHRGMVGSAVVRRLAKENCEILTAGRDTLDLTNQAATRAWLKTERPDAVVLAAARVGGILANNSYPADFLFENLAIQSNVIQAAAQQDVGKLLFLGSSCIYPRDAAQPMSESALLTGPLEATNEWYAIAKIAGIKLVQAYRRQHGCDFVSAMPTNLYGPGDNFSLESSHVLPALIRKAHDAKESGATQLVLWGTGTPRREFLHADDCADALVFLLKTYSSDEHINVGSGEEISILDLARLVCDTIGFDGEIVNDLSKPDGTPRKLMDNSRLQALGWRSSTSLADGIRQTYEWFLTHHAKL